MEESHCIQYMTQGFPFSSFIRHAQKTPPWIYLSFKLTQKLPNIGKNGFKFYFFALDEGLSPDMEFVKKFTQVRFLKTKFYPKMRKSQ